MLATVNSDEAADSAATVCCREKLSNGIIQVSKIRILLPTPSAADIHLLWCVDDNMMWA